MTPNSRFNARYGDRTFTRHCSSPNCHRTTATLSGRCYACDNRLRRFGAVDQELPDTYTLDALILRITGQRARHKGDSAKGHWLRPLEAHWKRTVDDARGRTEPSYKKSAHMTFNVHDVGAAATLRDLGDSLDYTRALDLFAALHLHHIERPQFYRSEDSFRCVVVELMRRAGKVGRAWSPLKPGQDLQRSYRKELKRETRLAIYRLLFNGLGLPAVELAKQEHKRAEHERADKEAYHAAIASLAAEYQPFTPDRSLLQPSKEPLPNGL